MTTTIVNGFEEVRLKSIATSINPFSGMVTLFGTDFNGVVWVYEKSTEAWVRFNMKTHKRETYGNS